MNPEIIDDREYFRIEDEVIIAYRLIRKENQPQAIIQFNKSESSVSKEHAIIITFDNQIKQLLNDIEQTSPQVAQCLTLMNRKFDTLIHMINNPEQPSHIGHKQTASISGGGIAFTTKKHIDPSNLVQITLTLLPQYAVFNTLAQVSRCEQQGPAEYFTATYFTHIHESDREKIVKHTIERQTKKIRENSQKDGE